LRRKVIGKYEEYLRNLATGKDKKDKEKEKLVRVINYYFYYLIFL
jgi:hypothetical protein